MVLYPVPLVDQTNEPTLDHLPDENASANCVGASLAAAFSFLLGKPYDGDELKDAVYGQGYTGATDPARFVSYAASQGVRMWEITGQGDALVQQIQQLLNTPGPILATGAIPSLWGDSYPGGQAMVDFGATHPGAGTHEVTWCGDDGGDLEAMNPWKPTAIFPGPSHYQIQPVSWWAARIVYGRMFGMERSSMSNVTPTWDAASGTLTFPAHDGLPQIALDHAQGFYAHSARQSVYPLLPHFYDGAGNDVVLWSDAQKSIALKSQNWAIQLVSAAEDLASAWTEAHTPPPPAKPAPAPQDVSGAKMALEQIVSTAQSGLATLGDS